jgi:NAD(P)H-flavin reductase
VALVFAIRYFFKKR